MNPEYINIFKQFFAIIWDFLQSPVPVLGLPWIVLFGGPFIVTVLLGSVNHIIGYSVPSIGDVAADYISTKDKVTDKQNSSKTAYKSPKDGVKQQSHSISYYAHMRTYNKGGK